MSVRVLSLPGWNGSGAEHWQSLWERLDARVIRVEQASWTEPSLEAWRTSVLTALATGEPTVLVGHSLGATLIPHLVEAKNVAGALLVAPPELSRGDLPKFIREFEREAVALPFPATVVASSDDPYASVEHSERFAKGLGARFENVGPKGHVNAESKLGTWPEGWEFLRRLRAQAPFVMDPRLAVDAVHIGRSELSDLLLVDEVRWPWFLLVPRRSGAEDQAHLSDGDRAQLNEESAALCAVLRDRFQADKVNVGALGNIVRQLHVHHIGRTLADPAWPGPVWGHSQRQAATRPVHLGRSSLAFSDSRLSSRFDRLL